MNKVKPTYLWTAVLFAFLFITLRSYTSRAASPFTGRLYVGGQFSIAGDIPSSKIAAWSTGPDFDIIVNPANTAVCPGNNAIHDLDIVSYNNFTDTVTLSAIDNPPGTSAVFGQNPIIPPDSTTLTIGNTGSASSGSYAIDVVGVSTTRTHTATVGLDILNPAPTAAPTLLTPANGATGVPNQPNFSWNSVVNGSQYLLEVATDAAFNTLVYTKTVAGTSHTAETTLADGTEHFWRVTAENLCGFGPPSSTFSFTTFQPVPDVGVTPGSFNVTLEEDTAENRTLTISNSGTAELTWNLTEDESGVCSGVDNIPWLTLSDTGGTVGTGQDEDVTLTFNANGLNVGVYTGSLCLSTNDPDNALINISLTMNVTNGEYKIYLPVVLN